MRSFLYRILFLCTTSAIVILQAGCGLLLPRASAPPAPPAIETTSGANPDVTPFSLELLEELNDGHILSVSGRVTAKVPWDPAKVLVRLSALDEQGQSRLAYYPIVKPVAKSSAGSGIPEAAPKQLSPGTPTTFALSIPSEGITNYQLELLWGSDAEPFLARAARASAPEQSFLALRNLEVHRVPGEDCSDPDACKVKFTITGEFFNSGSAVLKKLVLKAGFIPADQLDLDDQILENERRIEVRNFRLGPDSTRPFRLVLEKLVTPADVIAPKPVVRIVSFETE